MKKTIFLLVGAAIGSCATAYYRSSGLLPVLVANGVVWVLTFLYWLGRWHGVQDSKQSGV
jgi:predicted Abi (CAAX) family protease